jgi:hypothetical protein
MGQSSLFVAFQITDVTVKALPCAIFTPFVVMIEHAVVIRKIAREIFPLASRSDDVQYRVYHFSHIQFQGPSWPGLF